MFNKIYNKSKKIIKENVKYIIFSLISIFIFLIFQISLPYSIECPGGLIDIESRLSGNLYKSDGSLNLTYVSVREGTIPALIIALINPEWDIISNNDMKLDNETIKESNIRANLDLEASLKSSYYLAFKKANLNPKILNNNIYIQYLFEESQTDLKVGDRIIKVENTEIKEIQEINQIINNYNVGDTITFEVINNNTTYKRKAVIIENQGNKIVGISIINIPDIEVYPTIDYKGESNESGPSGGLMFTLAIYNALTESDLTNGLKISGTGTISMDGSVGEIGGIKYKLAGSVKNKADVFIVPVDNFDEAEAEVKKNNYNIKLIKAKSFNQVVEELNNLK